MGRWRYWARNGSLAVADQGLNSAAHFCVSVLLARWMGAAEYGSYAMAFAVLLLAGSIHHALVLEPLVILGPLYRGQPAEYLGAVLVIQAVFSAAITGVMALAAIGAAWAHAPDPLTSAAWGLAAATAPVLLFWTLRTACYLLPAAGAAAAMSGLYGVLLLGAVEALRIAGRLSAATALAAIGAASLVAAAPLWMRLRSAGSGRFPVKDTWREHWRYGRWALGSALAAWVPSNVCYLLAGALLTTSHAGALRALVNLVMPVLQIAVALSRLCLPYLSRIYDAEGLAAMREPAARLAAALASGAAVYGCAIALFHAQLFAVLYRGRFEEFSYLAPWMAATLVIWAAAFGASLGLRAIRSPSSELLAQASAAVVSIGAGVPMIYAWGVPGGVASLAGSTVAAACVSVLIFRRKLSRTPRSRAATAEAGLG